jgi:hypothetical protein
MVTLIPGTEQPKAEESQAPRRRVSPALIAVIVLVLSIAATCLLLS